MKYHRTAVVLATAASLSSLSNSNALDTTTIKSKDAASETNPRSAMFGYCIGCVALMMDMVESNQIPIKKSLPSMNEIVETTSRSRSSSSDLPEQSTRPPSSPFLPFSTNNSEYHTAPKRHHSFRFINLHQMNLKSISKSINEHPFLQDLLALCLFLITLAVGLAWSDNDADDEEYGRKRVDAAQHNKFDLVSRRLISDDFDQIGLASTNDDDEEEEEQQEEQDFQKKVKQNTPILPPPQAKDEPQWTLRYRGEWQPCYVTDNEDEIITEKEEVIILTKPIQSGKVVKSSILAGSASNTECLSSIRVTKKVSFQDGIGHDEMEVTSVSSMTKKRKGLWLKLSLGSLCDLKIRE